MGEDIGEAPHSPPRPRPNCGMVAIFSPSIEPFGDGSGFSEAVGMEAVRSASCLESAGEDGVGVGFAKA